jgi:hypothetical protein
VGGQKQGDGEEVVEEGCGVLFWEGARLVGCPDREGGSNAGGNNELEYQLLDRIA